MKRFLPTAWYISKCLVLIFVCQMLADLSVKQFIGLSPDSYLMKYNFILAIIGSWSANLAAFIYLVRRAAGDIEKLEHLGKEVIIICSCSEYVARIIMFLSGDDFLYKTFPMPHIVLVQYLLFSGCLVIALHPFFQKKPKEVETYIGATHR